MKDRFYKEVKKLSGVRVFKNINVKEDTNFRIDAYFAYKIEIASFFVVKKVFRLIERYKKKFYILGKGSNVLLANEYYDAVLVRLVPINNKHLSVVFGGDNLNYLNDRYLQKGISSLDFLCGVPCSIGGAICMNAGAFQQSIADVIEYVYVYDIDASKFSVFKNDECGFSYRHSYFKNKNLLIMGAKIKLIHMSCDELRNLHNYRIITRQKKLPLEYPNLGSIFKNPDGLKVGKLVDDLNLKGLKIGGSMISLKHGNVIVNYDNGKAKEVLKLIEIIKEEVYIKYKIDLELEIIIFK